MPDLLMHPDGGESEEEPAFWTFHPDGTPIVPRAPGAAAGTTAAASRSTARSGAAAVPTGGGDPNAWGSGEPGRSTFFPRVAVVVAVGLLFTALLMVMREGPFASPSPRAGAPPVTAPSPELKGTWHVLVFYDQSFFVETLDVAEDPGPSGIFTGTLQTPVGVGAMAGRIVGSSVSFTITVGTATETGTATLGTSDGRLTLSGSFSNTAGGSGSVTATRTGP